MELAFYGRVSTEDAQDPEASRAWQLRRARDLVEPYGHRIVAEFFDVGQSRSLPWPRRPEAKRLLDIVADPSQCQFGGVVIGEPQRAFYGNQFSLTFPVLTHFGIELWVPEVGGKVDPDSEAHDIVMSLFGGMSKGERSRIRTRTRAAMLELARNTDRFLGGRPPYGYTLTDAGPHPNQSKAAAGQRAHRLEPDPVTAPVVAQIYQWYADGMGLRAIAQRLTDEGILSPSAHDRRRNPHRDPTGWSHSAVRAILANPAYTGVRVWGKQEKYESLVSVDDVAAGTQVRMRWREDGALVVPERRTHEPLVADELAARVKARLGSPVRGQGHRAPRSGTHPYPLRGLLFCACGRRMQGARRREHNYYRCELMKGRSVPASLDHPKTLYLRESAIVPHLDEWISTLADPAELAAAQAREVESAVAVSARRKVKELEQAVANLTAAVEQGVLSEAVITQLAQRETELTDARAKLAALKPAGGALGAREVRTLIEGLGGAAKALQRALPHERTRLYTDLGLRLEYDYRADRVIASVEPVVASGVRSGTRPLATTLIQVA